MNNYPLILIDTGILVAFYDRKDKYHQQVVNFFRLNISAIATLDKDFNIYRRYRKQPFNRIFLP